MVVQRVVGCIFIPVASMCFLSVFTWFYEVVASLRCGA